MAEQRKPAGLSEEQLAEAEAEADVTDADLEEYIASPPVVARERAATTLSEEELAEADAESDLIDADLEES
jgi:hypothetical protein